MELDEKSMQNRMKIANQKSERIMIFPLMLLLPPITEKKMSIISRLPRIAPKKGGQTEVVAASNDTSTRHFKKKRKL